LFGSLVVREYFPASFVAASVGNCKGALYPPERDMINVDPPLDLRSSNVCLRAMASRKISCTKSPLGCRPRFELV